MLLIGLTSEKLGLDNRSKNFQLWQFFKNICTIALAYNQYPTGEDQYKFWHQAIKVAVKVII